MDIKAFRGLNNVTDPLRAGLGSLAIANNVNVTDTGAIEVRAGYSLVKAGSFTGVYTTLDYQRMYLIDGGSLKNYDGTVLKTGLGTAMMYWTEVNGQVFYNNGVDSGVILPDNTVHEWRWNTPLTPQVTAVTGTLPAGTYQVRCTNILDDGRETGTSDPAEITLAEGQALQISGLVVGSNVYISPANSDVYQLAGPAASTAFVWNDSPDNLGRELVNNFLDPLPLTADVVQVWKGRMYAAQYIYGSDQTVIWFSEPLGYHLFNLNSNFIIVPGRASMLAPHDDVLIIGTGSRVFAYDGAKLDQLADYGVVPGQHWAKDDGRILFWTTRGVCAALPFSNLTERQVSVAPGTQAGGTIVRDGGQKRYVVALQAGGSAFNSIL